MDRLRDLAVLSLLIFEVCISLLQPILLEAVVINHEEQIRRAPPAISGENIYVAWWTNNTANNNEEVMLRASTDGGQTFGDKINLSNTTDADSTRVEIDSDAHVQSNLATRNFTLAKEHAIRAIEILNSKDPVNNVAWRDEIAERNQRVAYELVTAVSNLENITESPSSLPEQQQSTNQPIGEIDGIIEEAITTRIDRDQRVNATIQATTLGDIINTFLRDYGNAYEVGLIWEICQRWLR